MCCGTNFNLVRDADGGLWSFGWSEFGVLGNGTDGEHNLADGSVKLSYQAVSTPARIASLRDKKIVDAACGTAHCVAAASDGTVYTWGNGGYGRLGHRDQANLHTPKALPELKASRVSAGSAYTAALGWAVRRGRSRTHTMRRRRTQRPAHSTDASPPPLQVLHGGKVASAGDAQLWMWGKCKGGQQDAWMYPKQEQDLSGWKVRSAGALAPRS